MQNVNEHLIQLADNLDTNGKREAANAIDKVIRSGSLQKVAQYVGAIGYVLKQNRAMGNCIRKKRVASDQAMQEIVMECLSEYQDGQDYHDTEWTSKYAQVVTAKPDLFDSAHITLLAQISETNNIPTHVANVKELCSVLQKSGVEHQQIKQVLDNFQILGSLIQKEVGEDQLPFKVAAPPSPRSWWRRLLRPSDSSFRSNTRGRNEDARIEMDQILENLMEINYVSQQIKLQVSQLKHQLSSQQTDPEIQQAVQSMNSDDWRGVNQGLSVIEQKMGRLPYESANFIRNLHEKISGVYQNLNAIQGLMKNLRQRDVVMGWENDQLGSSANEFDALDEVMQKLYIDPLNEEFLYYARRMHDRLDQRLKGNSKLDTGAEQWYATLRSRGFDHETILENMAEQMGTTPAEVDKLVSNKVRVFPTKEEQPATTTVAPEKQTDIPKDPLLLDDDIPPQNQPQTQPQEESEELTPEDIQFVDEQIMPMLFGKDIVPSTDNPREKASLLRLMLGAIFERTGKDNKIWQAIDKRLEDIDSGISPGPGLPNTTPPTEQTSTETTSPTATSVPTNEPVVNDPNMKGIFELAKLFSQDPIDSVDQLRTWLSRLAPELLDAFITRADHVTNAIGDAEKTVQGLLGPRYSEVRKQPPNYELINALIIDAIKNVAQDKDTTTLDKNNLRTMWNVLSPQQKNEVEKLANQTAVQQGIPDIDQYLEVLSSRRSPRKRLTPGFDQNVNEDAYREQTSEPMSKRQSILNALVHIADKIDTVDRSLADLIDAYIQEHVTDSEWPNFPEFSPLIREK